MAADRPRCVVFGAGGHALVVVDAIQLADAVDVLGILDADPARWGRQVLGVPVVGDDSALGDLVARGATSFTVGMGSVGDSRARRRLFALGLAAGLAPLLVVHPAAIRARSAVVGAGCQLLAGSIVNAGARLGANVIVNSGAIVEHDCDIGDHAHIATGARLASTVTVGEGAHIGVGASVRECLSIGAGAVVGAGSAVVRSVAPGRVVGGVPARELRTPGEAGPANER